MFGPNTLSPETTRMTTQSGIIMRRWQERFMTGKLSPNNKPEEDQPVTASL